ncbi:hypothetical protein CR513_60355, partial [Mucuna pruriens]
MQESKIITNYFARGMVATDKIRSNRKNMLDLKVKQRPLTSSKALYWFMNKILKEIGEMLSKYSRSKVVEEGEDKHIMMKDVEKGGNTSQRPNGMLQVP